jgi:hypothetical protein
MILSKNYIENSIEFILLIWYWRTYRLECNFIRYGFFSRICKIKTNNLPEKKNYKISFQSTILLLFTLI